MNIDRSNETVPKLPKKLLTRSEVCNMIYSNLGDNRIPVVE